MRRLIVAMMIVAAIGGCNRNSPTEPDSDSVRLAWCEDYAERCAWYTDVRVKFADTSSWVAGARGIIVSNATQEAKQFVTDASGSSGEMRWSQYVPRSTYWLTIQRGDSGGLTWQEWQRYDVQPLCSAHPEIERGVICRVTAEVAVTGIGR